MKNEKPFHTLDLFSPVAVHCMITDIAGICKNK